MSDLLPCPFCGPGPTVNLVMQHNPEGGWLYEVVCQGCSTTMPCDDSEADAIADWNRRAASHAQDENARAEALRLLAAEDARQTKLHELLETIREQIRLEIKPENRPDGLFKNIQDAVYAMRGRTMLMNDAAITSVLRTPAASDIPERFKHEVAAIANELGMDHQDLTTGKIAEFARSLRAERDQAISQVEKLTTALRFYADSKRYEGPNLSPIPDDPYAPEQAAYRWDVTRDHGRIASRALTPQERKAADQ